MTMPVTEEQIIAYVDGELGPIEALRFERAIEGDPDLAEQVARHRALRERIARHFAPVAEEPVPERLVNLLDRGPNVINFPSQPRAARPKFDVRRYGAIAATLAVGIIAGQLIPRSGGPAIVERHGIVVAGAGLARALDTQLASADTGSPYGIGVSFRDKGGHYCRTFDGAISGIGCHDGGEWRLRQVVAGESPAVATEYRQVGSTHPAILQAAQEMMAGAPLDGTQEKNARDNGWK